jgi:tetratricopeptide (TPR) repeat protein
MDKYREQLEGTTRLFRLRKIKRLVLLLLFVFIVVLSAYALAIQGAGLKPFYAPLDSVLPPVLVLLLIGNVTNFVFRTLELRYARRDSQRYLIAKYSIHRAMLLLMVCAIVGAILIVPFTGQAVNAQLEHVQGGTIESGQRAVLNFTSRDPFAFVWYADGAVSVERRSLDVRVTWTDGKTTSTFGSIVSSSVPYSFLIDGTVRRDYSMELTNFNNQPVPYRVVLHRILMPELTTFVPAILLAFAAGNAIWVLYLRPIRDKHEASSIYSIKHEKEVETGERTYAEYYRPTSAGPPITARASPSPSAPAYPPPVFASPPAPIRPALANPPAPAMEGPAEEQAMAEAAPAPTVEELLRDGSQLFAAGKLEEALAKFDEGLEADPTSVAALLAGAAVLLRLERTDEAMGSFHRVLEIDPKSPKALVGRAEVFESEGRWADAASTWARYTQVVPGDPEGRLRHAEALLKTGERQAALRVLEEARRGFPDDGRIRVRYEELHIDVPGLLSKALVASASGHYDDAVALLDRILAQEPENVNALVSKGIALRRAGRSEEALGILDAALVRQPSNTAALRAKGQIHEESGKHEAALEVYEALQEASPRDPEVWALEAAVLEKLGEPEESLASWQEAIRLDPQNREYHTRAQALEASRGVQEQFMEDLFTIKGMGPGRVRGLLAAGYRTPDAIRNATEDELANVRGMTRAVAKDLYRHFHPEPPPA